MITRFDTDFWVTAQGEKLTVQEMETDHLLNTLKMFIKKPTRVINMLVNDIETCGACACATPWVKDSTPNLVGQSIHNITSMTVEEVINYALNSKLGQAMRNELLSRRVNVDNYLTLSDSMD